VKLEAARRTGLSPTRHGRSSNTQFSALRVLPEHTIALLIQNRVAANRGGVSVVLRHSADRDAAGVRVQMLAGGVSSAYRVVRTCRLPLSSLSLAFGSVSTSRSSNRIEMNKDSSSPHLARITADPAYHRLASTCSDWWVYHEHRRKHQQGGCHAPILEPPFPPPRRNKVNAFPNPPHLLDPSVHATRTNSEPLTRVVAQNWRSLQTSRRWTHEVL